MGQSIRQSELFAGADWQVLYKAFTQINFNASDPPSINAAMRTYIQQNYPENYNDWIESSEFVAIIDLLSWLGGSLAFKTDLNARENFLETAESRESILRLARFLSYNPKRNQCAQGLLKIVEIATDDNIYDGYGTDLNNTTIKWNDPDDQDWFERFILVMNSALVSTNKFGVPLSTGTVGSVKTQKYELNNSVADMTMGFSAKINGTSTAFELINCDFTDGGGIYENAPNPSSALNFLYRNDGNGNASSQTGFFFFFKQGTLNKTTYNISVPSENTVLDLGVTGVNNTDVWVQTVEDSGLISADWSKVPAIFNENITYNNFNQTVRNIFSVITRDNDAVSIRFADGRFGNVPYGNIRVWYRTSNGLQYQIKPADMSRIKTIIPYYNKKGVKKNLTVTYSLQDNVSNSVPRETDEQIKARAPAVYATQNRMVSGEDYNIYPLSTNAAIKIKAVNRVYSGHSRFIDLQDPTGTYQDVNVFADDGMIYRENYNLYTEVPVSSNTTAEEIVSNYIQPMVMRQEVVNYAKNFVQSNYPTNISGTSLIWNRTSDDSTSCSGYFSTTNANIKTGSLLRFTNGTVSVWGVVNSISGNINDIPVSGTNGGVIVYPSIPTGYYVTTVIADYKTSFTTAFIADLTATVTANSSFDLWYDFSNQTWSKLSVSTNMSSGANLKIGNVTYYNGGLWTISAFGIRFVFESLSHVEWYNDGRKPADQDDTTAKKDIIRILKTNEDFSSGNGRGFKSNIDFNLDRVYYNRDGSINPTRAVVRFTENNLSGFYDNPDIYQRLLYTDPHYQYLFWEADADVGAVPLLNTVIVFEREADKIASNTTLCPSGTVAFQINGTTSRYNNTFWVRQSDGSWVLDRSHSYAIGRGKNYAAKWITSGGLNSPITLSYSDTQLINFQWKHYATSEQRIDPARTNIIDMFALTSEYDYLMRLWVKNGAILADLPEAPTELDIRLAFQDLDTYKMFSDQIVWRPAKYKMLFGTGADDSLKAKFKVVKVPNTTVSDGEVATQVIKAVNAYFDVSLWDFGETFYFSELAAYIHQSLANIISSVALVPSATDAYFGDAFEVRCMPDEIFISTAQVSDVTIISANTASNLKIR